MIESFNIWAKNITLAVIVVSILEMLLPNNKSKKYIKMVMGLYILFNIISPIIGQDISIDIEEFIEENETQTTSSQTIDQTSMNNRLKQIGENELEKDIINKLQEKGYMVNYCNVNLEIETESTIKDITIEVEKDVEQEKNNGENKNVENKLVDEIQKIKKIQVGEYTEKKEIKEKDLTKEEINQIKKFLIEEYEVNESCLKIN